MKVADFLSTKRFSNAHVSPDITVRELLQKFRSENVAAILVSDGEGSLDGIVTERDVARAIVVHGSKLLELPVSAVATTAAVSCSPNDQIADVAKVMTDRHLHHIPVMNEGRLSDVISIVDVLEERLQDRRRVTRALMGMSMRAH